MPNDKPLDTNYDELADNLLQLSNRNWIRDQLKMHTENRMAMQDSLSNLVKQRQALQLREHFSWLVWSVAQFYFGATERMSGPTGPAGDTEVENSSQFYSRVTIPDHDISGFEDQEPSISNSHISRNNPSGTKPAKLNLSKQSLGGA